jgi:hypothetical protein
VETFRRILVVAVKIFFSAVLSVIFYELVISSLHVYIYTYRRGMLRSDIWIGDAFFLLLESIPLIILMWFGFYWLIGIVLKKLKGNEK